MKQKGPRPAGTRSEAFEHRKGIPCPSREKTVAQARPESAKRRIDEPTSERRPKQQNKRRVTIDGKFVAHHLVRGSRLSEARGPRNKGLAPASVLNALDAVIFYVLEVPDPGDASDRTKASREWMHGLATCMIRLSKLMQRHYERTTAPIHREATVWAKLGEVFVRLARDGQPVWANRSTTQLASTGVAS